MWWTVIESERTHVWRDLYSLIYRYLRRRGVPHADAEDIAQEVLTAAYVSIDSIDPAKLRPWLLSAARNKMVDRYRSANRLTQLSEALGVTDPDDDPAAVVMRSLDAAALRDVMGRLSASDTRLLELYYFEERSLADVAGMTGVSPTAAKVALFRARRRLKKALETEEAP
jgi:RNA polymerase sigma-70 factor (ECF subfamily)